MPRLVGAALKNLEKIMSMSAKRKEKNINGPGRFGQGQIGESNMAPQNFFDFLKSLIASGLFEIGFYDHIQDGSIDTKLVLNAPGIENVTPFFHFRFKILPLPWFVAKVE